MEKRPKYASYKKFSLRAELHLSWSHLRGEASVPTLEKEKGQHSELGISTPHFPAGGKVIGQKGSSGQKADKAMAKLDHTTEQMDVPDIYPEHSTQPQQTTVCFSVHSPSLG